MNDTMQKTVFTEVAIAAVEASCYSLLLKTMCGDSRQMCEQVIFEKKRQ